MACYADEEEVWKCQKHPSKRRRSGICHVCLRERLSSLCPDCSNVRPCSCYATTSGEASLGRSRSLFMRSKAAGEEKESGGMSFWKMLTSGGGSKSKRYNEGSENGGVLEERRRMMRKSRSVAVTSDLGGSDVRVGKGKGWHFFPSPIKVLRQSIARGILLEKSPMHRG